MSSYAKFSSFGSDVKNVSSNPLAICAVTGMDAGFNNSLGTSLLNPQAEQCQVFMGNYCAANWDGVCEYLSGDKSRLYPNPMRKCKINPEFLNPGQILIRNAASEKYLKKMSANCVRTYEPFDPTTANSPLIGKWTTVNSGNCSSNYNSSDQCVPIYDVDAKNIDSDPVMNKILLQPEIAMDILTNIYNTRKRERTLGELKGTFLGSFYETRIFEQILNSGAALC